MTGSGREILRMDHEEAHDGGGWPEGKGASQEEREEGVEGQQTDTDSDTYTGVGFHDLSDGEEDPPWQEDEEEGSGVDYDAEERVRLDRLRYHVHRTQDTISHHTHTETTDAESLQTPALEGLGAEAREQTVPTGDNDGGWAVDFGKEGGEASFGEFGKESEGGDFGKISDQADGGAFGDFGSEADGGSFGDFGSFDEAPFEAGNTFGAPGGEEEEEWGSGGEDAWADFQAPPSEPQVVPTADYGSPQDATDPHAQPRGLLAGWQGSDIGAWAGEIFGCAFAQPPALGEGGEGRPLSRRGQALCSRVLRENRQRFEVPEDVHEVFTGTGTQRHGDTYRRPERPARYSFSGSLVQVRTLRAMGLQPHLFRARPTVSGREQQARAGLQSLGDSALQQRAEGLQREVGQLSLQLEQMASVRALLGHEVQVREALIAALLELIRRTKMKGPDTTSPNTSPSGSLRLLAPDPDQGMSLLRRTLGVDSWARRLGGLGGGQEAGLPVSDQTIRARGVGPVAVPIIPYRAGMGAGSCLQLTAVVEGILGSQGNVQDLLADYITTL